MAYSGKTNWVNNEIVEAVDMNRIEQGIIDLDVGKMNNDGSGGQLTQLEFANGGIVTYNEETQILDVTNPDGSVMNVGKELWIVGKTAEVLLNGDLVQYAGTQGDYIKIKKAVPAEINANPSLFLGICTTPTLTNQWVKVTRYGEVNNINTSAWLAGDILYFDPVTGGLTPTEPGNGYPCIELAVVQRVHESAGILMVDINNKSVKAKHTQYDNSVSGLAATNTQDAIDGLKAITLGAVEAHMADYAAHGISHKNLLYNWDFRNPLNQRGFTSTAVAGYTIDRWRLVTSGHTVELTPNGLKLTASSGAGINYCLAQDIENYGDFEGKTLTLSVHIVENTLTQGCGLRWNDSAGNRITGTGLFSFTFTPSSLSSLSVGIQFRDKDTDSGKYVVIDKMKLEIGNVSTLANDPPADYGAVAANAVQANLDAHMAENATDTQKGHVILASSSETELGTNATKAVTPAGLKEVLDKRPSLIDNRIPVPSGADMNDYITPGNYRILDVATAGTLINYPAPYGGTLEVWRYTSVFFIQRLITSTTGVFYQRTCVNGVWSSWDMTYNTTNITVSTSAPVSALAEGFQHQVY